MGSKFLDSIVYKIIAGRSDWNIEELQYYKNNPREIESALVKERLKVPVQCNCESIMIVPYGWNLSMLQIARAELKIKRFLFASDAVVLALYHNMNISGHICVMTDDTIAIEIGIYNLGDGVFETVSTRWICKNEEERLPMVCNAMLRDLELSGKITQIIFARTSPCHINVHDLERMFQRPVLQVGNLTELCNIGASVQKGVLQGHIKDVLPLQLIPQAIGVLDEDGSMLQIVHANDNIPTLKTKTAYTIGSELSIRQGNNAIAIQNPVITTLHFSNTEFSQRRQVEIAIGIDANYVCQIKAKDINTNEIVDAII